MGFNNIGSALIFGCVVSFESLEKFSGVKAIPHGRGETPTFEKEGKPISVETYTSELRRPNLQGCNEGDENWEDCNTIMRDGKIIAEVSCSKEDILVHAGGEPYQYTAYVQFKRIDVGGWHPIFVDPQKMIDIAKEVKQEDIDYALAFIKKKGIHVLLDEEPDWFLTYQDEY